MRKGGDGAEGDIVEKAETHCCVDFSVVPWGPDGAKNAVGLAVQYQSSRFNTCPGSQSRGVHGAGTHIGVWVDHDSPSQGFQAL